MAEQVDFTSTQPAMQGFAGLITRFLELIRFSHTIFALPFAALACVWALRLPFNASILTPVDVGQRLLGVLLCMVTARSAAMAFNRLVDAEIDAKNPRTAVRHLPAGLLSKPQVWLFFVGNALGYVAAVGWPPPGISGPKLPRPGGSARHGSAVVVGVRRVVEAGIVYSVDVMVASGCASVVAG